MSVPIELRKWLAFHRPTHLWTRQTKLGDHQSSVHFYSMNGKTFIIMMYASSTTNSGGFDIYVPITDSNDTIRTIEALTNYLDIV